MTLQSKMPLRCLRQSATNILILISGKVVVIIGRYTKTCLCDELFGYVSKKADDRGITRETPVLFAASGNDIGGNVNEYKIKPLDLLAENIGWYQTMTMNDVVNSLPLVYNKKVVSF